MNRFLALLIAIGLASCSLTSCKKKTSTPPPKKDKKDNSGKTKTLERKTPVNLSLDIQAGYGELWKDLVHFTQKGSKDRQLAAWKALGEFPLARDEAAKLLFSGLDHKSADVRELAQQGLVKLGKKALPVLYSALEKGSDKERTVVLWKILTQIKPPVTKEFKGHLKKALAEKNEEVRSMAVQVLVYKKDLVREFLPQLQKILDSGSLETKGNVAAALGNLGPEAASAMEKITPLVNSSSRDVQSKAIMAVAKIKKGGEPAIPTFVKLLESKELDLRINAAYALGQIGGAPAEAVTSLVKCLRYKNDRLKLSALEALGKMGSKAAPAIPAVIATLANKSSLIQSYAARTLGEIKGRPGLTLNALWESLFDTSGALESAAEKALSSWGPSAIPFFHQKLQVVQEEEKKEQAMIFLATVGKGNEKAAQAVFPYTGSSSLAIKQPALRALGKMEIQGQKYLDLAQSISESKDPRLRSVAASILIHQGEEGWKTVEKLVYDKSIQVQMRTLEMVGQKKSPQAQKVLWKTLAHPRQESRHLAAFLLLRQGKEFHQELVKRLNSSNELIQEAAVYGVRRMGDEAKEYASEVISLIHHKNETIRKTAVQTLAALLPFSGDEKLPVAMAKFLAGEKVGQLRKEGAYLLGKTGPAGAKQIEEFLKSSAPEKIYCLRGVLTWPQKGGAIRSVLLDLVKDKDSKVSAYAARILGKTGPKSVPGLAAILNLGQPRLSRLSSRALGEIGKSALEALQKGLDHDNWQTRAYSAQALGRLREGAAPAVDQMIEKINDTQPQVREAVVNSLGLIVQPAEKIAPFLLGLLDSKQGAKVKKRARMGIIRMGHHIIPWLLKALDNKKIADVVSKALGLLGAKNPFITPFIMNRLSHSKWQEQANGCYILSQIGPEGAMAAPVVARLLSSRVNQVRTNAFQALAKMGSKALPTLKKLLSSRTPYNRFVSLKIMGKMAEKAAPALPEIIDVLDDKEPKLQALAIETLTSIGKPAVEAVKPLEKFLTHKNDTFKSLAVKAIIFISLKPHPGVIKLTEHPNPKMRTFVLSMLRQVPVPRMLHQFPMLLRCIKDKSPEVRLLAIQHVQKFENRGQPALPALLKATRDKNKAVRVRAGYAISDIVPLGPMANMSIPPLIENLTKPDLAFWSALTFEKMGDGAREAVPHLIKHFSTHRDVRVKIAFVRALAAINDPVAVPHLIKWFEKTYDGKLKQEIMKAWPAFGEKAKDAVPLLVKSLSSTYPSLASQAAESLGRFGKVAKPAVPALEKARQHKKDEVSAAARRALANIRRK